MKDVFGLEPGQWSALRALLDEALDLPADRRERWLEVLDPRFAGLRPRLRALLAHAGPGEPAAGLYETLPKVEPRPPGGAAPADGVPRTVGPYRLIEEIGAGGMASVWKAERTDMLQGRQVALKLPHAGWRGAGLAERLAREREILATLEHPNIARLYDAGVAADGQPYLALEYVEGERIDLYCERRDLSVPERLRLFVQVARAVAHAHAQLVVHRDLKPGNVLVTSRGEVKLLDFGVAKLLEGGAAVETELTQLSGRALTPGYAAPEQILGRPIGTAADVYALGVVLFELLTGARPYQLKRESRAALEDAIVEAQVPRPSGVAPRNRRHALRGDLDTIVLKALRKEPRDRYATADALADDVERHLANHPVLAQPDTAGYRLRKFARRHRLALGVGAAVLAAVLGGAGLALWQAHTAELERRRASREADAARQSARLAKASAALVDFLTADLAIGRSTTELEQQIDRAIAMVRAEHAADPLVRAHLLVDLCGRFRQLGNWARFRALSAEAVEAAREAGDRVTVAQLDCWHARDLSQAARHGEARALVDRALAELRGTQPQPGEALAACLLDASAISRLAGDSARAIAEVEEASRLEVAAGEARTDAHADTLFSLARAYGLAGRYREAAAVAQETIDLRAAVGKGDSPGMVNSRGILATFLRDGGLPVRALPIQDGLVEQHRSRGGERAAIGSLLLNRALTLMALGRAGDALPEIGAAREGARAKDDPPLFRASTVAEIEALVQAGRTADARAALDRAGPLYAKLRTDRLYIARLYLFAAARVALAEKDAGAAGRALDEAEDLLSRAGNEADPSRRTAHALRARGEMLAGRFEEARRHADLALALSTVHAIDPQGSVRIGEDLLLRAEALRGLGDLPGARREAELAIRHLEAGAGPDHPGVGKAREIAGR
jgi:serine/threonine-protein kinase